MVLGKTYYLLTRKGRAREREQVRIEKIRSFEEQGETWHVFELKALAMTRDAALLFWLMRARLCRKEKRFLPLWPPMALEPFGARVLPGPVFVLSPGEGTVKSLPALPLQVEPVEGEASGELLTLDLSKGFDVLLGRGRQELQERIWLRSGLAASWPEAKVEGIPGEGALEEGRAVLTPSFDGTACLYDRLGLCGRFSLKGGEENLLSGLLPGRELRVFAGLDLIARVTLTGPAARPEEEKEESQKEAREEKKAPVAEEGLLRLLARAGGPKRKVPRLALAYARQLGEASPVGRWILREARKGEMREEAIRQIRALAGPMDEREGRAWQTRRKSN